MRSGAGSDPHRQSIQENVTFKLTNASERTLPDNMHMPPHIRELFKCLAIPQTVGFNFVMPKLGSRLGQPEKMAIMSMPEAPVHKNDSSVTGKDQVGPAKQPHSAQPVSQSLAMECMANNKLNRRVLTADTRH